MPVCWPCVLPPASTAPDSALKTEDLGSNPVACYKRAIASIQPLSLARPRPSSPRHARQRPRPEQAGPSRSVGSTAEATPPGLRPSSPGQELICSSIGLTLKASLALVACVSLVRLGGAYQQRLDRYGEVSAVHDIQEAKLLKARNRFDSLFATGGEQKLLKEQDQWIAPNRLRVVWTTPAQR